MTNKENYKRVFNVLATSNPISLEVNAMKNKKKNLSGKIIAACACCVLLACAGTGVYATAKHFGILDFTKQSGIELPENAADEIKTDIDVTQKENNTIYECSIKEALCDSESIMLVYEVHAKESNKYLFIPEDAMPEDSMKSWGYTEDKTIQEYATEKNLTIVNIGGGILNRDELGIAEASMDFVSVEDDVMDIFIHCGVTEPAKTRDIKVIATGHPSGDNNIMRLESTFSLQDMSTTSSTLYTCNENTFQGTFFKIEKAEVIQTDLGTYVDIYYSNDNAENPDDGLTFNIVDQSGNELTSIGGSGIEALGNNQYKLRCMLVKCKIGETLYIKSSDCYEKNVYGISKLNQ